MYECKFQKFNYRIFFIIFVIIVFYNEVWLILFCIIYSVLEIFFVVFLKEIILVDDLSDRVYLKI